MYIRIVNREQLKEIKEHLEQLRIYSEVIDKEIEFHAFCKVMDKIEECINIFSESYGDERSINDDGGFVALFTAPIMQYEVNYTELVERYCLSEDELEWRDLIVEIDIDDSHRMQWIAEMYVAGTEYNIVVIHPVLINKEQKGV